MTAALITLVLTFGALGLFLALPRPSTLLSRAGFVLLAGAAAAALALVLPMLGPNAGRPWFAVLALIGLIAAVRVITHKKPVYSALYFILVVVSVGGLLVLMSAEFLAAALLIIYAGAILVTYLFVIMLAQQGSEPAKYDIQAREPFWGVAAGFVVLAVLAGRLMAGTGAAGDDADALRGPVASVGELLLTEYVVGIQIAGLLLLAAMVGAIAIARRKTYFTGGDSA